MSDTPVLYSFEIVEKNSVSSQRLGIVATTVTAIVGATLSLTSSIIGAVKAKKNQEAMERAEENINVVKNHSINTIRAYNSEAFRILNDSALKALNGVTTEDIEGRKIQGIVNDGYKEYSYYFPEGITGAVRELNLKRNDILENGKKLTYQEYIDSGKLPAGYRGYSKMWDAGLPYEISDLKNVLNTRLKQYGLKLFQSPPNGYFYIVGINDTPSEWNYEGNEDWFDVDVNGDFSQRSSGKYYASERRAENYKWDMRKNVRDSFIARIDWLRESGLPSFIWRGYLQGDDSRTVGIAEAKKHFSHVSEMINQINKEREDERLATIERERVERERIERERIENEQKSQNNTGTTQQEKSVINKTWFSPISWYKSLSTKNKIIAGSVAVAGGLYLLKE